MTRSALIRVALREFEQTLSIASKWYDEDLANFKKGIALKTDQELETTVSRLRCLNGKNPSFNGMIAKELAFLEQGGMFDLNNAKPENCLD